MSKKTKYVDLPWKAGEEVLDLLPPPSKLVLREDTAKVTLELTKGSIRFFKQHAKRNRVPYQRMLRNLIDAYVRECETRA